MAVIPWVIRRRWRKIAAWVLGVLEFLAFLKEGARTFLYETTLPVTKLWLSRYADGLALD